jgi:Bacterial regulatory proteins, tetR family
MSEATLQRRDELLTAAQELFSHRGYEATSVRDFVPPCFDVGYLSVSRSSFYRLRAFVPLRSLT